MRTTPTTLLAALSLAVALAGAGCSKKGFDLPQYPGSSQAGGTPNLETEAGTIYRIRRMTPDGVRTVATYYRAELVDKLGWSESEGMGPTFEDGNLEVEWNGQGAGEASPVDPTRPGGTVMVFEADNRTFIYLWRFVPKS
ncbi:MAG: hypothetical protein NDI82_10760 [Anaeromyxobacteraceae bacterium]|nr:hypothetical protein [Anaeromyxobacteraceae bacterium]